MASIVRRVSDVAARVVLKPAVVGEGLAAPSTTVKAYWDENRKGLD